MGIEFKYKVKTGEAPKAPRAKMVVFSEVEDRIYKILKESDIDEVTIKYER